MQPHDIQRCQLRDGYHKQSGNNRKVFSHVICYKERGQRTARHQQLFTDFHNFNQLRRIIIQVHHITGFLCSLRTAIHSNAHICLCQCRSIICTVSHHCHQFTGLLLFLDIFHLIFRLSLSYKIIHTSLFCDILCCQRIISSHHHRLHSHLAKAFETFLNTWFDDVLQLNNAGHLPVDTHYQRCTAVT